MRNVIAIDGPAGSGKSTVSRLLAEKLNWMCLDTGAMYRAVALAAKRRRVDLHNSEELGKLCKSLDIRFRTDEHHPPRLFLDKEDVSLAIRRPEMDMLASRVSTVSEVREAMACIQRRMAKDTKLVAEGRDMGSVVFPKARYKFFLTASDEVRADRRYRERLKRGESVSKPRVAAEMRERDHQDETRSIAPLRPATNARIIDSSTLIPEEVVDIMLGDIMEKKSNAPVL